MSVERHTQNLSGGSMMNVLRIVLPDDILIIIIGIKDIFECFMMVLNYRAAEY